MLHPFALRKGIKLKNLVTKNNNNKIVNTKERKMIFVLFSMPYSIIY